MSAGVQVGGFLFEGISREFWDSNNEGTYMDGKEDEVSVVG
jgi:hypothetical protein